jgi:cytochrome c peroxidase
MRKQLLLVLCLGLFLATCKKDDFDGGGGDIERNLQLDNDLTEMLTTASNGVGTSHFVLPESNDFINIPQDPNNPITTNKVALGRLLYHETGLALNPMKELSEGTYSCASCHFASAGFQAGRFQGIGEGGIGFGVNGEGRVKGALYEGSELDVQPIRTPTAMNGAFQKVMLWNGQFGATSLNVGTESEWTVDTPKETNKLGFEGLETQAIAGLAVHRMSVNPEFFTKYPAYQDLFDQAFSTIDIAERYTIKNAGLAVAAYERTLLANEAPFQKWLRGDELALTDIEKEGAILFFGKANCGNCHNGPALNKMEFHGYGMKNLDECPEETFKTSSTVGENLGRGSFTKNSNDNYKFKVPQLYNLSDSPFLGHGASFRSVKEVVVYKNNGIAESPNVPTSQLADDFVPLNLTEDEVNSISAFLENGLRDPNLKRYEPESLPSGNCFPFNDPLAASELGCN